MTWMILHTGQLLDQGRNAGKRPQVGPVPTAHRACNQGLSDLGCLFGRQLWFPTGLTFAGEARFASLGPRDLPSIGHLTAYPKPSAHLWGRNIFLEEGSRLNPPLLHLNVVTLEWHVRSVHGSQRNVTLLCDCQ